MKFEREIKTFQNKPGDRNCFRKFYLSNSVPKVIDKLPQNDVFEIFDLSRKVIDDLDGYSTGA